jgi:hypothetical protein
MGQGYDRIFLGLRRVFPSTARPLGSVKNGIENSLLNVHFLGQAQPMRNRINKHCPMKNRHTRSKSDYGGLHFGRLGGIRTRDPLHPMQVRYQAALQAENSRKKWCGWQELNPRPSGS